MILFRAVVLLLQAVAAQFIHNLQDCWQTKHLFTMCDYCDVGDLRAYSLLKGNFEEEAQLFAAELGSALGHLRLSDFGLSWWLKQGGRLFTTCGTIQYMAPEVVSVGPYDHGADCWSLGILLFSLVTVEFPVPAEPDHKSMFNKVNNFPYAIPKTSSSALTFLLSKLLYKNPAKRLRILECFKMQAFFRGTSFDSLVLQKKPVKAILSLRTHPSWAAKAIRGLSLDY